MKLGYRDRIILLVVLIVVVLGIGIFVFIKPKWEDLSNNQKSLESLQNTWEEDLRNFDTIPIKQNSINKRYEEALKISENFTDEMSAVELDQFLQKQFINIEKFITDKVELVDALAVSDEGTSTLNFYYYTPSIVTYPLYEYADLDGSLAKAVDEKLAESNEFSSHTAQTVGSATSTFTLKINKEDAMSLIDAVHQYAEDNKDAMILNSVQITEYNFNGEPQAPDAPAAPEEGQPAENTPAEGENVTPGYTNVAFSFTVYYMQEPMKPDVGPEYNKTIWDGSEWRAYTTEPGAVAQTTAG